MARKQKESFYTSKADIQSILNALHHDPFQVLGMHLMKRDKEEGIVIRAFLPQAQEVNILSSHKNRISKPMKKIAQEGFFEVFYPGVTEFFSYRFQILHNNASFELEDTYRFLPVLTEFDLYLISEGTHYRSYEKLGAHSVEIDGVIGVLFAVWAPNAHRVSVVGDFNDWDTRRHMMRTRGNSGIWELFIPGICEGAKYKFRIKNRDTGAETEKVDPFAFYCEVRPKSAGIICSITGYKWNDQDWMERRRKTNWLESPMAIYEVHPGSWRQVPEDDNRSLTYREMAHTLVPYVKKMGYTHIEFLPVTEHPLDESWGYQTIAYYAPTSRFGTPDDFMYLIDTCHQNGISVIIDWVPSHFPKDGHGLARFDGSTLYEHEDPRKGEHKEWGTLVFNYGRNEVRNFLISNALFWLRMYHIDGLRMDAVASMLYLDYARQNGDWLPNKFGGREHLEAVEFLKQFNVKIHEEFPGVLTIAEESTAWPMVSRPVYLGGLGFDLKWNMGWMHDMLEYISKEPIHRTFHHNNITFSLLYAFTENFILPLSHDEVVHGKSSMIDKMPGDLWQKFATLRLFYTYMYGHPGKKLLFMGGEIGQWTEWWSKVSLDWHLLQYDPHRQLQHFIKDLNHLYSSQPALFEVDFHYYGFEWIDFRDTQHSVIAFLRKAKNPLNNIVFVCNFTPVPRMNYRIGVPESGYYKELLNSDSSIYGGSNMGNRGGVMAENISWHGFPYSINLILPPLGGLIFKRI